MKFYKEVVVGGLFFLGIGLFLWAGEDNLQRKEPRKSTKKSLIKKELLLNLDRELRPSRRNIFSPVFSKGDKAEAETSWFQQDIPGDMSQSSKEESGFLFNIRYIGYIISKNKIIALVIFKGIAMSAETGEMLGEEIRVGEITPKEIEIIGPDSKKRKFSLEGEEE